MRANLPADAVLLVREPRLGVSSWAERAVFYESENASQRYYAWRRATPGGLGGESPYTPRAQLQRRFLETPTRADLRAIRSEIGTAAPLFALDDRVRLKTAERDGRAELILGLEIQPLPDAPAWGAALGAERVHSESTLAVWRLPDPVP
jgi:hypothetical protein